MHPAESSKWLSHRKGKLPMPESCFKQLQRKAKVWGTLWPEIDILCSPLRLYPPSLRGPPLLAIRPRCQHQQHIENNSNQKKNKNTEKTGSRHFLFLSLTITDRLRDGRGKGATKGAGTAGRGQQQQQKPKGKHQIIDKHPQQKNTNDNRSK